MAGIDWNATAAMVQAIFSVIAIGVAIVLNEVQNRRSTRLIESERARLADDRARETQILALWVASSIFDLRIAARNLAKLLRSFKLVGSDDVFPAENAAGLRQYLAGIKLEFDAISARVLDIIPKLELEAGVQIIPLLRRARRYDHQLAAISALVGTGQIKTDSLAKAFKKQAFMLTLIESQCAIAYSHLASAYGFDTLEEQEATLSRIKADAEAIVE